MFLHYRDSRVNPAAHARFWIACSYASPIAELIVIAALLVMGAVR
jgi:hypothetical protein